jgi:hypothetical protein
MTPGLACFTYHFWYENENESNKPNDDQLNNEREL